MKRVCVIFGGVSCEHEVSRISASNIIAKLDKTLYSPVVMEISKKREFFLYEFKDEEGYYKELLKVDNDLKKEKIIPDTDVFRRLKVDVVFPALHGTGGEDGILQGFLQLCDVAYVGCDVLSSAICFDKVIAKDILVQNGICVADYLWFSGDEIREDMDKIVKAVERKFSYPVFIKPSECGSSVGINKVKNRETLVSSLVFAANFSRKVLVEEFVEGEELEVAVLGSYEKAEASCVGQILASNEFYDYNAKYIDGKTKTLTKADIGESYVKEIRKIAVKAFRILGCYGLARVDFFLTKGRKAIVNELNTMPGFTGISMYPMLWEENGLPYKDLLTRLITLAEERKTGYQFLTDYTGIKGINE